MLDYAANARTSFSAERMGAWLEESAQARGASGSDVLADAFGVDDPESFWLAVDTNLQAERFRLIFVSDVIPPELRRIIEFLNSQMTHTDVLAIEVKQYVDEAGQHQTIVPRVIGDTEASKRVKRSRVSKGRVDRASLLSTLRDGDPSAALVAQALLTWGESRPELDIRWNRAGDIGLVGMRSGLLRIWGEGTVEVKVNTFRKLDNPWDDSRIEQLLQSLEQIDGVSLKGNRRQWPRTRLAPLAEPVKHKAFTAVFADVIDELTLSP
jgi:hypothetical protein